ncbi:hypothetical protein SLS62_007454 [Diatrype stigma]|uniref:aminodeoxychorismate synthase n=1 Tax=Diatrype stigma TaxID=117547 RepID=A0AAN9UNV2_9PEZI
MDRPRILFLDAYDSFSNNIVSLLTTILDVDVEILSIDSPHFRDDGDSGGAADGQGETDFEFRSGSSSSGRRRLANALRHYDAVVCGPGPGSPASARDVGLMRHVWALGEAEAEAEAEADAGPVPALGICLGFQSLVLSCGGAVRKLRPTGLHGMIRAIDHDADSAAGNVFRGVPPFKATLYHSLHVDIGQDAVSEADWPAARWRAAEHLPDIVPLAWTYEDRGASGGGGSGGGRAEERILMGVRHRAKPFWGLQYHPESICTEPAGHQVIRNWFEEAVRWNRATGRVINHSSSSPYLSAGITRRLSLCPTHAAIPDAGSGKKPQQNVTNKMDDYRAWVNGESPLATLGLDYQYQSRVLDLPAHVAVPDVVEILQEEAQQPRTTTETAEAKSTAAEFIILDSASASASVNTSANESKIGPDVRGRYSIIALDVDEALKLQYTTGDRHVTARVGSGGVCAAEDERVELGSHSTIWQLLGGFWARRELTADSLSNVSPSASSFSSSPFLGGFMGYITYELGLEGIGVRRQQQQQSQKGRGPPDQHARPDLCFVWVTKSIVIDHLEGTLRVQTLAPPSSSKPTSAAVSTGWLDVTAERLSSSAFWRDGTLRAGSRPDSGPAGATAAAVDSVGQPTPPLTPTTTGPAKITNMTTATRSTTTMPTTRIQTPDAAAYEAKVRRCQEFIASGDSYELCLTDQTLITTTTTTTTNIGGKGDNSHTNHYYNDHNHRNHGPQLLQDTASWKLYRRLRERQPAPYGSYLRLGGATLVSSSPERFLEFDGVGGRCSMRPMKGTVRKGGEGRSGGATTTLEQAERLLRVPKEEAENLMIVDLVRHDLHGVCGAGGVSVPHLLKVEEYASVFQMVSVVEGRFPPAAAAAAPSTTTTTTAAAKTTVGGSGSGSESHQQQPSQNRVTGLDVLAASLPPGSMTGAPKKRSCELLLGQGLEGQGPERSLYSGVVGYMDVAGRGDWSVTIRSLFRWDDETTVTRVVRKEEGEGGDEGVQEVLEEVWHIGAGGAVTALSTPEGEREEMFTKLRGPLGVFEEQCLR